MIPPDVLDLMFTKMLILCGGDADLAKAKIAELLSYRDSLARQGRGAWTPPGQQAFQLDTPVAPVQPVVQPPVQPVVQPPVQPEPPPRMSHARQRGAKATMPSHSKQPGHKRYKTPEATAELITNCFNMFDPTIEESVKFCGKRTISSVRALIRKNIVRPQPGAKIWRGFRPATVEMILQERFAMDAAARATHTGLGASAD